MVRKLGKSHWPSAIRHDKTTVLVCVREMMQAISISHARPKNQNVVKIAQGTHKIKETFKKNEHAEKKRCGCESVE